MTPEQKQGIQTLVDELEDELEELTIAYAEEHGLGGPDAALRSLTRDRRDRRARLDAILAPRALSEEPSPPATDEVTYKPCLMPDGTVGRLAYHDD